MVSRIDIGPDGGPYVAINENSNDLELQDINGNVIAKWDETAGQWDLNNNSLTGINAIDASSANVGSLSTESLGSHHHFAEEFDGSSPVDRLNNALSEASQGDFIYLETGVYDEDITIGQEIILIGTGTQTGGNATEFTDMTMTWGGAVKLRNSRVDNNVTVNIDADHCVVESVYSFGSQWNVDGIACRFVNNRGTDVTFESGTDRGIVDASTDLSVTDNGDNTVGDIA